MWLPGKMVGYTESKARKRIRMCLLHLVVTSTTTSPTERSKSFPAETLMQQLSSSVYLSTQVTTPLLLVPSLSSGSTLSILSRPSTTTELSRQRYARGWLPPLALSNPRRSMLEPSFTAVVCRVAVDCQRVAVDCRRVAAPAGPAAASRLGLASALSGERFSILSAKVPLV